MIRLALVASLVASMIGLGVAQAAAQTPFKVGVTTRQFAPAEPYEWRRDANHELATVIRYPADPGAGEQPRLLGPPDNPLFDGGRAAADAALAPTPPPEFGDLRAKAKALADSDEAFRAALAKDSRSYRDKCLRAVFAMAPALGPAFTLESLEKIGIPVAIVAGVADAIMPVGSGARALAAHIAHAELTIFPGDVGHCVFLAVCTEAGRATLPALCIDAPLVSTATRSMPRPCGSSRRSSPAI